MHENRGSGSCHKLGGRKRGFAIVSRRTELAALALTFHKHLDSTDADQETWHVFCAMQLELAIPSSKQAQHGHHTS